MSERQEGKRGEELGWGGAAAQSANRKEERNKQRGLTDLSGICTCEGNRQIGQIKGKRQTYGKKDGKSQSGRGQGCTECLRLSGPQTTPQPWDARAGRWLAQSSRRAPPGQEPPPTPRRGPEPEGPVPATRGRCRTVPAGLRCTADRAAADGHSVGGERWAGRTDIPILLRGAVSGRGRPEGPRRLVEGSAGCKGVPRGVRGRGQGLGGDRAGQGPRGCGGPRPELRRGVLQPCSYTSG